jgi:uncharacterized protein
MQKKYRQRFSFALLCILFPSALAFADETNNKDLITAVVGGQHARVVELLKQGADPNAKQKLTGWTAISVASYYGYPDIVKELVRAGANVNVRDVRQNTPLMRAVTIGPYQNLEEHLARKVEVTKILLESGANPYMTNRFGEPTWRIPEIDHHDSLAAVFENAGIAETDEVELMEAIARNDLVAVRAALGNDVDLNFHDAYGWTFLKQAEAVNNPQIRKLLLAATKK